MTKPSTDLIDRYLQAVGFWLPRDQKQDILAEISEDLRSQLEDREAELGCTLTESEVSDLLKQRGRPILVAGQFLPQRSLIGPALYPIYIFVLKIVALCYVIPWLLVWFGILLFHRTEMAAHLAGEWSSLGSLWTIVFTQFGIITLVFAAIDRVSAKSTGCSEWDPRKLPKVKLETSTKRRCNAVAGIVFGIFGLLWLLAIPDYPFLIIGPAAYLVKGAPIWQTVYWPLVALAVAGIFEHIVRLLRPRSHLVSPDFRDCHHASERLDRQHATARANICVCQLARTGRRCRSRQPIHTDHVAVIGCRACRRTRCLRMAGFPGDPPIHAADHARTWLDA